jgi:dephospho-CoA kinase
MSSDRRHSSALTQGNPLYARRNQRAARSTNNREIPDLKEKFHQDPLTVQISNETVINRYETRETQTETPLESDIKDDKPCSCKLARATC